MDLAIKQAIADQPALLAQGQRLLSPRQIRTVIAGRGFEQINRPLHPLDREDIRRITGPSPPTKLPDI